MVSKVRWLLLDLDNTLLDFDASSDAALRQTFIYFGISNILGALQTYHRINADCWKSFEKGEIDVATLKKRRFDQFVEEAAVSEDGDIVNHHYLTLLAQQRHEIEGASDFLTWAARRFHLALATNGFAQVQRPRIRASGFDRHFKHLFISEEVGHQKPKAAFFETAFDRLGQPNKDAVMMVGDSLHSDIQGANNYGMLSCWFDRKGTEKETDIVADFRVRHFADLKTLLTPHSAK